ncbi:MAG TPA: FHA domain-containing protein [Hyphomicrobiaceae bacterium]|nr:FHA domain-containing protein [Hyphomicrobiaceae bacterium]
MKDDKRAPDGQAQQAAGSLPNRILGSLRDALQAASRDDRTGELSIGTRPEAGPAKPAPEAAKPVAAPVAKTPEIPAAVPQPPLVPEPKNMTREPRHFEADDPTTQLKRGAQIAPKTGSAAAGAGDASRTQVVRGRPKVLRNTFHSDPVVGWLVVIGGPGLGAFRPVFEGNNAIGRGKDQRIPIDFGDATISSEEQGYIRYDSMDRSFLFVPNLSKTNIVAINDKKPTGAVKLELMDVITMGRTQLAFVPFCGDEFDWSELSDLKE